MYLTEEWSHIGVKKMWQTFQHLQLQRLIQPSKLYMGYMVHVWLGRSTNNGTTSYFTPLETCRGWKCENILNSLPISTTSKRTRIGKYILQPTAAKRSEFVWRWWCPVILVYLLNSFGHFLRLYGRTQVCSPDGSDITSPSDDLSPVS